MGEFFCPKHGHRYVFDYSADAAHPENQCVICIRDDNLALRARLAQVERERDEAVAATRELLATNIRSCALSRTTRGIDGMIRDELLRLAERVKTNAWEQ